MTKDIAFAGISLSKLGIGPEDVLKINSELRPLLDDLSGWYPDEFRASHILRLWPQKNYETEKKPSNLMVSGLVTSSALLPWTEAAVQMPEACRILESCFFSWMKPLPRCCILHVAPNTSIPVHVDIAPSNTSKLELKLRLVLDGDTSGIFFLNKSGEKLFINEHHDAFVLNGSMPHGYAATKKGLTMLVMGYPWNGANNMMQLSDLILPGTEILSSSISSKISEEMYEEVFLLKKQLS